MKTRIQFLQNYATLKDAFQDLGYSGQSIKKYFSSKMRQNSIHSKRPIEIPLDFINQNLINPDYEGPEVNIISEDDNYLAVNKPERFHCFPHLYNEKNNLLSFLRAQGYHQLLNKYSAFLDRNLLFRIDYETSGLVLFSKGHPTELADERANQIKKKIYTLIVTGHFEGLGKKQSYFKGVGAKGAKVKCSPDMIEGSQVGELEVLFQSYDAELDQTIVLVSLISGRRHQIRSQFAALGFPLLGDELYGGEKYKRLCLHSTYYEVGNNQYYCEPLFIKRDFLNLYSRFQVCRDQLGIG